MSTSDEQGEHDDGAGPRRGRTTKSRAKDAGTPRAGRTPGVHRSHPSSHPGGHDSVVDRMRAAILRGDFAPNQRLVEAELCEQYGASRFTVRAALRDLAAQGLVELQRNRGARIREITLDEAVEITQVRMVVEGLVARLAAERVTPDSAALLQEIGRAMREAVAAGEHLRYSDLNARLHSTIRAIARHDTAQRIIEELRGQVVRHQFALSLLPGRSSVSLVQHERIIAAIVAQDPDEAEAAMRAHITSVIEALHQIR